ncbi:MAG TPA: response regulator [Ktedonobacterales bacterium]|nr:response regulator [Ktedonobacterales bacterium]
MEIEPEPTPPGGDRRFRVLLVDDNIELLEAVRFALLDDYFIETATSAEDALERIEQLAQGELPDCMVVDVKMPGLNGVQLVRILRGDPTTAQIPLIILSAYVQGEDILRGQLAGVDRYLAKPFDLEVLIDAIQQATRMTPEQRLVRLRSFLDDP